MITEEDFLNLVKITSNIDKKNMQPGEEIWLYRGANLLWLFYNILESEKEINPRVNIEYIADKYNEVNYLIMECKRLSEPTLKKLIQEYLINLPGMKFNPNPDEYQPIEETTKQNYLWVLMSAKNKIKEIALELEKVKIYEELINNITPNSDIIKKNNIKSKI